MSKEKTLNQLRQVKGIDSKNPIPNDYWDELNESEKEALAKAYDEASEEFEKYDALKEELCDVRCMLDLMVENKIITNMELNNGANLKRLKLMQWSSLLKK